MEATVHRLRPRRPDARAEALQLVLQLEVWPENVRIALNEHLSGLSAGALASTWGFTMVNSQAANTNALLLAIKDGPRPFATIAVWFALWSYMRIDTCEIIATQRTVAKTANVTSSDVYRAYKRLVEIGALIDEGRGKYRMHPTLVWKGQLAKRAEAEKRTPKLELVQR